MKLRRSLFYVLATGSVSLAALPLHAIEPAPINLGPVDFLPVLQVTNGYDDNIRANNENLSSWYTRIQPTFVVGAAGLKTEYQLSYSFVHDYFYSYSSDKKTDHFVNANAFFDFNTRNRLLLSADFSDATAVNDSATPDDEFQITGFNALYSFGVQTAPINVDFGFDTSRTRTQNEINDDKDLNARVLSSTLYYRISPRTRLLAEVRRSNQDYKSNNALDSTNMNYLVGGQWEATAFTTGSFRLGQGKKKFKDDKPDVSQAIWELGLTWEPLTYSRFNISTRSSIEEGDEGATSIDQQNYRIGWTHDWNAFISSTAAYSLTERKFRNDEGRRDKNHLSSIGLDYSVARWVDLGLRYEYTDNKSNLADESYTRNQVMLTLTVGL